MSNRVGDCGRHICVFDRQMTFFQNHRRHTDNPPCVHYMHYSVYYLFLRTAQFPSVWAGSKGQHLALLRVHLRVTPLIPSLMQCDTTDPTQFISNNCPTATILSEEMFPTENTPQTTSIQSGSYLIASEVLT
eukprot:Gregarina_sp_Poly_1__3838@NODE_2144_length_2608_cov_228_530106_g1382_i0_p1_GENE_NODE_2144_length_2608_cov_228_530106_g1382_i0NODE_2144_length_2608_cov_228_530106_g1382_i0_p1_ORF_typecomplete_len132_score4_56STOP/PF05217_12/0_21_NODE_2144_length_2608_cov_228_530106_g1382_i0246641